MERVGQGKDADNDIEKRNIKMRKNKEQSGLRERIAN